MSEEHETNEPTPEQIEGMICTVITELAAQALKASKVTGDPRIKAISDVAIEQLKKTKSYEELLLASIPTQAEPVSPLAAARQQAMAANQQQQAEWNDQLNQRRIANQGINQQIDELTQSMLKAMQEKVTTDVGTNDPQAGGTTNQIT